MTVRELLARIGSDELSEWSIIYGTDPWGQERADLRAGIVASTVANCMTENASFRPSDFVPTFGPPPEEREKTMEELKDAAIRMAAMMGGMR